ncbi:hypothetical protein [Parafrankia sp. EUN1f]|uniref:hypothetical protein n=1 Tax=Parafrankia sp. EUN1f TaxID=102897 RepID=UPI001E51A311|nr:hypothetical protein [Parafrankia sp. EUN1f]
MPAPDGAWQIAVSIHLPAGELASAGPRPVLVALPGGGYNRRYFDLPAAGFSQAEHHCRRGTVVVAIDHLGVGDSTVPPPAVTPGVVSAQIACIDVPVLLATGERDVCRPLTVELAGFVAATDLAGFVVPRMAHMHNFAETRTLLWERLDDFIAHVARTATRSGG